jgi:hypothetical protein
MLSTRGWQGGEHCGAGDNLLFGVPDANIDLSTLHPDTATIFKLWQVYQDNVDPLLKVTHTPTLQVRIINAIGGMSKADLNLQALMFGIYCMAVRSVSEDDECEAMFGSSRNTLVRRFHLGCQQGLSRCSFLDTNNIDCVTALYLYAVWISPFELSTCRVFTDRAIAVRPTRARPPRCLLHT